MSKFLNQAKTSKLQLAICPITGIAVEIKIPVIAGKIYTYPHPLSIVVNSIGIAKLSYKEKLVLGNEILAGSLLSLLSHYSLIEDKLSSVERNILIRECNPFILHSLLYRIATATKFTIQNWPHLSLSSAITAQSLLSDYLAIISGKVDSDKTTTYAVVTSKVNKTTKTKTKTKANRSVSPELRQRIKVLISEISTSFPVKVIQVLQIVVQGNNLYSVNPSLRQKIVDKLVDSGIDKAATLADIIDSAANVESEDITQHFVPERVMTLKEIIESKLHPKVEVEIEPEQPIEQEQEIEEIFYPSFKHDDCDACEYECTSCKQLGYCYTREERKAEFAKEFDSLIEEEADEEDGDNDDEF